MKKRSVMARDPLEFDCLIRKWQGEARTAGYDMKKVEVKRQIARNMAKYTFRPDQKVFKIPDLEDKLFPIRRKRLGRKGNVSDSLWWVGMFFVVVVLAIVLSYGVNEFNTVIQNDTTISNDVKTPMDSFNSRMPTAMDSGLVLAFFAAHIGIIFLGILLRSHPMVFPFLMLVVLILTLTAGYLSNAYDEIASEPELSSFAQQYPLTSWMLDNYLLIVLITSFIDILAFTGISGLLGDSGI